MTDFLSLALFDFRARRRYLLTSMCLFAALPLLMHALDPHFTPAAVGGAFAFVLALPFTFIGQERLNGTMAFLTTLPFSRRQIVIYKGIECILWGFVFVLLALVPMLFLVGAHGGAWLAAVVLGPGAIAAGVALLSCGYFLFPAQAVTRAFLIALLGLVYGGRTLAKGVALTFTQTVALAYGVEIILVVAAVVVTVRVWGRRPSP